jgi:hypothetical protein
MTNTKEPTKSPYFRPFDGLLIFRITNIIAPAMAPAIMKNTSLLNEKSILNLVATAVVVSLSICLFVIPLPSLFLLSLSKGIISHYS